MSMYGPDDAPWFEPVLPIGEVECVAFINRGPDISTHTREIVIQSQYPPADPWFRESMHAIGLSLGETARGLECRVTVVSGMCRGSMRLAPGRSRDEVVVRLVEIAVQKWRGQVRTNRERVGDALATLDKRGLLG